jgi:phospholipase C
MYQYVLMAQIAANPNIKHVFVLMLENRSFDHMLGFSGLKGTDAVTGNPTSVEGCSNSNSNIYQSITYPATNDAINIMRFDPGHEFKDVVEQLCGTGTVYNGGAYPVINNSGFVSNYATTKSPGEGGAKDGFNEIMKCYDTENKLPVMMALAREFAVCDQWLSSLPGPTWPNRFFVHAASSGGLDHSPTTPETLEWEKLRGFSFANGTIYDSLVKAGHQWRIYRGVRKPLIGAIPSVAALKGIQISDTMHYEDFAGDMKKEYPYAYTFIEPNYGDIINGSYGGGQSQHPMDDVQHGELLIKSTYEALRNSPLWASSMLIVTYDEHGGFYDHFTPPSAVSPGDTVPHSQYNSFGFNFDQYGVRVPAIVISAYTPKNIISHLPYDHSSVPATLEKIFNLPPLTKRDAAANTVGSLATLPAARPETGDGAPPLTLPNISQAVVFAKALTSVKSPKPIPDSASVEGGNLPGFLYVVRKAQLEKAAATGNLVFMADPILPRTRGEAREYLETHLPGLLNGD